MEVGGYDVEFELPVAGRLEDTSIDLDLLYTRSVQCSQCRGDTSLLACSRRTVDEEVWEVSTLSLL